jgi:hypothetical protein
MIFDFYENFSRIYPIKREDLINPDRSKFGYFWDFEDYLIEGVTGRGLTLKGFLITSEDDFEHFKRMFDRFFLRGPINSIISEYGLSSAFIQDTLLENPELKSNFYKNIINNITDDFNHRDGLRKALFDGLKRSLKENNIWIPLYRNMTKLLEKDIQSFWGNSIKTVFIHELFGSFNIKGVWEEIDELGPIEYSEEMAWTDLAFSHPELVKYIDEEMRQKTGTEFLGQCHDFGLI